MNGNLPKLFHYPDSTQSIDLKVGLKAGKAQDLLLRHSPKPEQKIVCILVRGSKTGADNVEFFTDNSGKTILNISALTKASLPKDRLVIQIDNSIFIFTSHLSFLNYFGFFYYIHYNLIAVNLTSAWVS